MAFEIKIMLVALVFLIQSSLVKGQNDKHCFEQLAFEYLRTILLQEKQEYHKLTYFVDPTISRDGAIDFNMCLPQPKLSDKDSAIVSNINLDYSSCKLFSDSELKSFRYRTKIPWFRKTFKRKKTKFIEVYQCRFVDPKSCIVLIGVFGRPIFTFYTLKIEISSGRLIDFCSKNWYS